jgi:hypothetical protein
VPITAGRRASSISTTMMGTEITPFTTALQYSARIGSMLVKHSAVPISVAPAMMP